MYIPIQIPRNPPHMLENWRMENNRGIYVGRWLASSHKLCTNMFSNVYVMLFGGSKGSPRKNGLI
jgi:hypothetical protein